MMLVTPFALTLAMGFAFGGFGGGGTVTLSDIPVQIVNQDQGQLGARLVELFGSEELDSLILLQRANSELEARQAVDQDQAAAAVIIPPRFSESILPSALQHPDERTDSNRERRSAVIELYANPTRPVSVSVVRSIIDRFTNIFATGSVGGQVVVSQLLQHRIITPEQAQTAGAQIGLETGQAAAETTAENSLISLAVQTSSGQSQSGYDWRGHLVPSMAVLFLMFTVASGGRSILAERQGGTLPRLLTSPNRPVQIIGGKAAGIFLIGLSQMAILLLLNSLLFRMAWEDLLGLVLLTIVLVTAASGWGVLLAAYARTPAQASNAGTIIALVFAASAGNFVARQDLPEWLRNASLISPNAWGLEGYSILASGGTLSDLSTHLAALLLMAVVLFGVSSLAFRRQFN